MLYIILIYLFVYFHALLYEILRFFRRFTRLRQIVSNDFICCLTESNSFIVQFVTVHNGSLYEVGVIPLWTEMLILILFVLKVIWQLKHHEVRPIGITGSCINKIMIGVKPQRPIFRDRPQKYVSTSKHGGKFICL